MNGFTVELPPELIDLLGSEEEAKRDAKVAVGDGRPRLERAVPRHTFASLLLQQGESPVYVKEQMGRREVNASG